jgi:hypothetical protein
MRVGLVTWDGLPGLSGDDQELVHELERSGVLGRPQVWSDRSVDWSGFDALVLRSTWDYHRRIQEFLAWVERASAEAVLWNPADIVRWNSHKSYLRDLESHGVPIVPTRICGSLSEALEAQRREGWDRAVLKPAVSAAAYRTHLVDSTSASQDPSLGKDLAEASEILVQPYQPEVERSGERSLVFFLGKYSHAFLRAPHLIPSPAMVEGAPTIPSEEELQVARKALGSAPGRTLYGRVDLVPTTSGGPRVMELEVIEPFLGLKTSEHGARTFAGAVSSVLRAASPR